MTPTAPLDAGDDPDLNRFLADLRRSGTVIDGPVAGGPDDVPGPVEWLVTGHRGTPVDPPYRLVLDEHEFASAVERDAQVIEQWWPDGDARARAYTALLVSFDAALAERATRSRHRRHEYLVLGYLEVEAAHDSGAPMDAAMGHLQDQLAEAFDALAGEPRRG